MKISLEQAAQILGKTENEVLYVVQDRRLNACIKKDADMIFNEDGTVTFLNNVVGDKKVDWEFNLAEVLNFKRELDAGLDGTLKRILHG